MALLAAIVVITNTTLVSVTQKTREIGVRRALGASRSDIMREVVAESLAGVARGRPGRHAADGGCRVRAGRRPGIDIVVEGSTVAWAIGAAGLSGLLAGYYPARRATRIDVIAAVGRSDVRRRPGRQGSSEAAALAPRSRSRSQKLRSALAIAGIVIGIVTVVLVATVLVGVRNGIAGLFRELGTENVFAFHRDG